MPADRPYCVQRTFGDHSGMLSDQNDYPGRVHLAASTEKAPYLVEVNKIDTFGQKPMFFAKYQRSGNEFSIKSPHTCYRARECPQTACIASGGPLGIIPGCYQTRTTIQGAYTSPRPRFRTEKAPYLVEVNKICTFGQKPMVFAKYRRSGKEFSIKSPHICYRAREWP